MKATLIGASNAQNILSKNNRPVVGQTWYVLLPGSNEVNTIEIVEFTASTILVRVLSCLKTNSLKKFGLRLEKADTYTSKRYATKDVNFLELIADDKTGS